MNNSYWNRIHLVWRVLRPTAAVTALLLIVFLFLSASIWREERSLYRSRPFREGHIVTVLFQGTLKQSYTVQAETSADQSLKYPAVGVKPSPSPRAGSAAATDEETATTAGTAAEKPAADALRALPYLPAFTYNANRKQSRDVNMKSGNTTEFSLAATVKSVDDKGQVVLEARSTFTANGKRQSVTLTGTAHTDDIRNGKVSSRRIAGLNVTVNHTDMPPRRRIREADLPEALRKMPDAKRTLLLQYLNTLTEAVSR